MSVTLEKVDEVRNRTGASYGEAKEALTFTEGDVLEAVIYIEQMRSGEGKKDSVKDDLSDMGNEIIEKLKELVKQGQVTRILLRKDDKNVLDVPVVAGAVGALIFTGATTVGIIAALATGCDLYIVKEDGEQIDIREVMKDTYENAKDKVKDIKDKFEQEETIHTSEMHEDVEEEDIERVVVEEVIVKVKEEQKVDEKPEE